MARTLKRFIAAALGGAAGLCVVLATLAPLGMQSMGLLFLGAIMFFAAIKL